MVAQRELLFPQVPPPDVSDTLIYDNKPYTLSHHTLILNNFSGGIVVNEIFSSNPISFAAAAAKEAGMGDERVMLFF